MAEWFKDWFASDFYLSVYTHRNDEDAVNFLNNILKHINILPKSKVLDAACGSGRHSIFMAQHNFEVTAFDLSLPLLKIAKGKGEELGLDINFFNADMRFVNLNEKFKLILNLFTSFGYFDNDTENFAFIRKAYDMLETGGYYIFDYLNENFVRNNLISQSEKLVNGINIKEKRKINNNRVIKEITIAEKEFIYNFEESVQLYSFNEINTHFNEIGFKTINIFGNYNCDDFSSENSERLIIIFQK